MIRFHRFWMLGMLTALLWAAVSPAARAQEESPPARVGRISYIGGSVSFEPAGTQDWAAAELNRPVTIGDRIWTDWDSRAEIELGDAVVRLGSRTGFSFLNLTAMTAQMQLTAGTAIVHVRTLASGELDEIDTPNLALSLEQPGTYRVDVDASGDTTSVEVISGEALASGGGQTFPVAAQHSATFTGTDTLSVVYTTLGMPDALDDWSMARDREEAQAAAQVTNYVSPEMVGIYDLDTYGSWENTPDWGYAWFPNVVVGWAPYRFGHWVWIFPWGWTWVDDEPWGFAPFHYGRWAHWHNAWCWVPGPRDVRPIYAPALVAWVRGHGRPGPHHRPRRGRHIGWLPLGPRDVYLPGYAAGRSYVRDINLTNTGDLSPSVVNEAYRHRGAGLSYANRRIRGAITAVPRAAFSASQPADAHRVVLTRRGLLAARLSNKAPAITPSRLSVLGARMRTLNVPPRQLTHRAVVARRPPARAAVSFARQQAVIRANAGRSLTMAQWARYRPNRPAGTVRLAPDIRHALPQPSRRQAPTRYRTNGPARTQLRNDRRNQRFERTRPPVPQNRPARAAPLNGTVRPRQPPPQRHVPRPQYHAPAYQRANPRQPPPQRHVPRPQYHAPVYRRANPRQPPPQRHVPRPQYRAPLYRRANRPPRPRIAPDKQPPFAAMPQGATAPPMYRAQQIRAPQRVHASLAVHSDYAPPRSPPPMYRPVAPRFTLRAAPSEPRVYQPTPPRRVLHSTPTARAWRAHPPRL